MSRRGFISKVNVYVTNFTLMFQTTKYCDVICRKPVQIPGLIKKSCLIPSPYQEQTELMILNTFLTWEDLKWTSCSHNCATLRRKDKQKNKKTLTSTNKIYLHIKNDKVDDVKTCPNNQLLTKVCLYRGIHSAILTDVETLSRPWNLRLLEGFQTLTPCDLIPADHYQDTGVHCIPSQLYHWTTSSPRLGMMTDT